MAVKLILLANVFASGFGLMARKGPIQLEGYSFGHFVSDFGRGYERGSAEWAMREQIFEVRMKEVREFQAGPARSWQKGITRFMDYTQGEYGAMLGYKGRRGTSPMGALELSNSRQRGETPVKIPSFIDVGSNSTLGSLIRDQGSCGSCWAEASTSTLESHMENNQELMKAMAAELRASTSHQNLATLSSQAIVSCTENPHHCGGKGGCEGATAELAFDMVAKRGLPLAVVWPYVSSVGNSPPCKDDAFGHLRVGITGREVLPSNKLVPLKEALVKAGGPIVVSVDASNWQLYTGGIFSDTEGGNKGDFTVNHAVTLMGFRDVAEGQQGYWLIKNSWGAYWGENGFIKLEMKANEEDHCGWDYSTHEGLACDDDPDTAWVCGTCGVLYDSSYPLGLHLLNASDV